MRRLAAVALALVLLVAGGAAYLGSDELGRAVDTAAFVSYPSVEQVSNYDYLTRAYAERVARGEHPKLVFGSSELNADASGSAHPANLLRQGRYDIDVMVAGRAGCNSLWQAIEAGAMAPQLYDKRVVLFVSMQWFMCYRNPSRDLAGVYSQGAYDAFMDNPLVSDDSKAQVTARLHTYGIDRRGGTLPTVELVEGANRAVSSAVANARLAWKLETGAQWAPSDAPEATGGAPDWDAVFSDAQANARALAIGNDYGFEDSWYQDKFDSWLKGAQGSWHVKDGAYFSAQELEDFKLALQVCKESGITPLVVIQPVKGEAYDQTVYTREVREQYYDMIRQACAEAGVDVADFSGHEYDTYFLRDYSHPSDLGGAYYSRAIYSWYEDGEAVVE